MSGLGLAISKKEIAKFTNKPEFFGAFLQFCKKLLAKIPVDQVKIDLAVCNSPAIQRKSISASQNY